MMSTLTLLHTYYIHCVLKPGHFEQVFGAYHYLQLRDFHLLLVDLLILHLQHLL